MIEYLAHSATEASPEGQPLKEHLNNVAELAASFGEPFDASKDCRQCGLYHDIGKYSEAFQRRVRGSSEKVDHSSAGAVLLFEHRNIPAAMCIAGHHGGLSDIGNRNDMDDSFMGKINRAKSDGLEDYSIWKKELPHEVLYRHCTAAPLENYFYTKMLFSALTDADWLDTEAYFRNVPYTPRKNKLTDLKTALDRYISPWWDAKTDINKLRCKILRASINHGQDQPGMFTLTVPTGGGKTIASMAFALYHAERYGLRRVIYVIPYCSILEQTKQVFEDVFGKECITAHYSEAEYDYSEQSPDIRAFSAENWESPIILTTAVQFFESIYSAKPGKNRKVHNIARSVIIFDEAQMLPVPLLRPCLAGIGHLTEQFGCSAVLCTATQPAVEPILREFVHSLEPREICPEPQKMYQRFRRVIYQYDGNLSESDLSDQLRTHPQVLCVVNSRRQAQMLFSQLSGEEGTFHLSTTMIPKDRKTALATIRERLRPGRDCRVISTSLIEAGVDLDFPVVYRALAGLDSIIQAGGRCNREGKRARAESIVHVFETDAKAPKMLEQNIAAAGKVIRQYEEIDSPEAICRYFHFLLYTLKDKKQLDEKEILLCAQKMMFATVSRRFRVIDSTDFTVYIPRGDGAMLVSQLRNQGPSRKLLRLLDQYAVSVYRKRFEELCDGGAIERVSETAGILSDPTLYSDKMGLSFETSEQDNAIFF